MINVLPNSLYPLVMFNEGRSDCLRPGRSPRRVIRVSECRRLLSSGGGGGHGGAGAVSSGLCLASPASPLLDLQVVTHQVSPRHLQHLTTLQSSCHLLLYCVDDILLC